jgi:hypothetical protein
MTEVDDLDLIVDDLDFQLAAQPQLAGTKQQWILEFIRSFSSLVSSQSSWYICPSPTGQQQH